MSNKDKALCRLIDHDYAVVGKYQRSIVEHRVLCSTCGFNEFSVLRLVLYCTRCYEAFHEQHNAVLCDRCISYIDWMVKSWEIRMQVD